MPYRETFEDENSVIELTVDNFQKLVLTMSGPTNEPAYQFTYTFNQKELELFIKKLSEYKEKIT